MPARYTHKDKVEFARVMRKNPTPAERQLWYHVRRNKLGYRFHHQFQLAGYIVDFYCPSARVAIEVDGSVHDLLITKAQDAEKERVLEERGVRVLRVLNEDVLSFIGVVIARIKLECDERRALKALSGAIRGGRPRANSSSRSSGGKEDWTQDHQHQVQEKLAANPAENPVHVPPTPEDIAALNDGWRKLIRRAGQRANAYPVMTTAESANDQKLRLAEWLKKRSESAALAVKGMHVTEPAPATKKPSAETENRPEV